MSKGGSSGGLSLTTLAIAAVAAAVAAVVTSTFWPEGSLVSAALTPVVVALVNEALRKPTEKVSAVAASGLSRARPSRLRGRRGAAERAGDDPGAGERGGGGERPYTVYGSGRPRIRYRLVLLTAGLAFVIAVLAITVPERLFGGAVANDRRTTFFPERSAADKEEETKTGTEATTEESTTRETTTDETTTTAPEEEQAQTTTAPETPPEATTTPEPAPGAESDPTPTVPAPEAPDQ